MLPIFCCSQWQVCEDQKEQNWSLEKKVQPLISCCPELPCSGQPQVHCTHRMEKHLQSAFSPVASRSISLSVPVASAGLSSVWHTGHFYQGHAWLQGFSYSERECGELCDRAWFRRRGLMDFFLCTWFYLPQTSKKTSGMSTLRLRSDEV